ncbi:MAG: hypothetical protein HRT88_01050 [Lentisphaeraceae bacterium]|nr:hypothetical protein [Lentisphaeraceae bacterium]
MKILQLILTSYLMTFLVQAQHNERLIPQSCNTIIKIDIAKIREIPLLKALLATKGNTQLDKFKTVGLTPEKILSLTVALNTEQILSRPQEFQLKPQVLFLVKMKDKFDYSASLKKTSSAANKMYISQEVFHGIDVSTFSKNGRAFAISQLNDTCVVIGGKSIVEEAILLQLQKSTANVSQNKKLNALLDRNSNMLAIDTLIPKLSSKSTNLAMLTNFNSLSIKANFDQSLVIRGTAICKNEQIAQQMNAILNMAIGMELSKPQAPLKAENINIAQAKEKLLITLKLSTQDLTHILLPLMLKMNQ